MLQQGKGADVFQQGKGADVETSINIMIKLAELLTSKKIKRESLFTKRDKLLKEAGLNLPKKRFTKNCEASKKSASCSTSLGFKTSCLEEAEEACLDEAGTEAEKPPPRSVPRVSLHSKRKQSFSLCRPFREFFYSLDGLLQI